MKGEKMSPELTPWSAYLEENPIASAGRRSLISAFSDLVRCQAGFQPHELPEIFGAPKDEGENDACRRLVALDAALLTTQFVRGKIATFARPIGGGEAVAILPAHWEIDDPLPRFATGTYNAADWAKSEAHASHRIFVDGASFEEWLAALKPLGILTNRELEEALDPQVRAARAVAARRVRETSAVGSVGQNKLIPPSVSPPDGLGPELLTLAEVCDLIRKGRSSIYAMVAEGQFPEPIKLGSNSRWSKQEVLAWIEEQAARRGRADS